MKVIFYYTDVLPILSKGEAAIAKLKYNLDFFRERQEDVCLVWHPYSRMEELLQKNNCALLHAYQQVVADYKAAGWGIFDESEDVIGRLQECDAYYGDVSDLPYYSCEAGHPALLIDYDCLG